MEDIGLPTPEDPGRSPVWESYVVAQTVQASLGQLPRSALAVGVRVDGTDVQVVFRMADLSEDDAVDMDDIVSELEALVGNRGAPKSGRNSLSSRGYSSGIG